MNKMHVIALVTAVLLTSGAVAEERHERREAPGIGVQIGPGGAAAHVGPLHGGIGVTRDRHHEWHRGYRTFTQPDGWYDGDTCWRRFLTLDGWVWEYTCY